MRSSRDLENKMKNLADKTSTTPPEFIWENVDAAVNPKKKRRFFMWFFFMGLFLLLWIGSELIPTEISKPSLSKVNDTVSVPQTNELNNAPTDTNTLKQSSELKDFGINKPETHSAEAQKQKITEVSRVIKGETVINQLNGNRNNETSLGDMNSNRLANTSYDSKGSRNIIQSLIVEKNNSFDTTLIPSSEKEKQTKELTQVNELNSKIEKIIFEINDLDLLKSLVIFERNLELSPALAEEKQAVENKIHRGFFELGSFIGMHQKSIDGERTNALLAPRQKTESEWYSWGLNMNLGWSINKNIYISSGFEFSQSKNKFYYEEEEVFSKLISNSLVANADTSFVQGRYFSEGEVRYNAFEIPLTIGLQKEMNQWNVGVELSALYNFKFTANGKILSEPEIISRIENEGPMYKNSLGIGYKTSLVFEKSFNDSYSLLLKPSFKFYQNEIQDQSNEIKSRLNMIRVDVSLRKSF